MNIHEIASIAHEANRQLCVIHGDLLQVSWDDCPPWQKDSAIDGVKFHLEHPHADPYASHENWMRMKLHDGWVWGKEKDPAMKLHPCLMPYYDLPAEQKAKDVLFQSIVHGLRFFIEVEV